MFFLQKSPSLFDDEDVPKHWLERFRRITHFLILSVALNFALLVAFVYMVLSGHSEEKDYVYFTDQQQYFSGELPSYTNAEVISFFEKLSFKQLLGQLTNLQIVEDGYTYRDLSLAYLVNFHYFDIEKALSGMPKERKYISIEKSGDKKLVAVFPGLGDQEFEAILYFARSERWPLTSEGLFLNLKKKGLDEDSSLVETFMRTPEYMAEERVFESAPREIDSKVLLEILLESDWDTIKNVQKGYVASNHSGSYWRDFLLNYVSKGSRTASYLLLELDRNTASHKLDDETTVAILDVIDVSTPAAKNFAVELITSPRSDLIWNKAAQRLYQWEGENIPENYHQSALARFAPHFAYNENIVSLSAPSSFKVEEKVVEEEAVDTEVKPVDKELTHTVEKGDTLWQIARNFNININKIRENNNLLGDKIVPGQKLKIILQE